MDNFCIIIHVGVGKRKQRTTERLREVLDTAVQRSRQAAEAGKSSLSVVKECIRTLEDSPLTNAGLGSSVNRDCEVECDASIIDGSTKKGASVCAVPNASNPIDIAHMLAEKKGPACLVGKSALRWFEENGGENCQKDLITSKQRKMHAKCLPLLREPALGQVDSSQSGSSVRNPTEKSLSFMGEEDEYLLDTVGAVALVGGKISAGVSSGGTFLKYPGRVGQAGVYGTGCWANEIAGISTSGTGEHLIRTLFASRCVEAVSRIENSDSGVPPVVHLKSFIEKEFISSPVVGVLDGTHEVAAGVIGIVYDRNARSCDLIWAHTSANFIVAYSIGKRDKTHVEICSQPGIDDIEKVMVYASGKTVRLRE